MIPKHHGAKLTDIPDDQLSEILPVIKRLSSVAGGENYNVLQNNGRLAHQEVDHVSHGEPRVTEKSLAQPQILAVHASNAVLFW